jgi:hypothetical protein
MGIMCSTHGWDWNQSLDVHVKGRGGGGTVHKVGSYVNTEMRKGGGWMWLRIVSRDGLSC